MPTNLIYRPDYRSLGLHLPVIVGSCLLANGSLFLTGTGFSDEPQAARSLAPAGYVVGLVWVGLFGLMATAW